jgi:membrane dipeptidase
VAVGQQDLLDSDSGLLRRGWNDQDLAKLAGGNVLRVMRQAEAVAKSMKDEPPATAHLQPPSATDIWK